MRRLFALMVVVIVLMSAVAAAAQTRDQVMMGGYMLLRIRCAAGGMSIAERVEAVQKRVNALISLNKPTPIEVTVSQADNGAVIEAEGRLIITVDSADARANKTTPLGLANAWASRIRELYPLATPSKPKSDD